jgi:GNAT superfamily N-acetyltransferase
VCSIFGYGCPVGMSDLPKVSGSNKVPKNSKTVLPLEAHKLDRAAEVLGQAFRNVRVLEYVVPDEARRVRLATSFVRQVVRYSLSYGEVYNTPALEGVACWLPPENPRPTYVRMLRTGLLTESLKFGWAGLRKLIDIENYLEKVHRRTVPGPHWYLWWLGVDPSRQGEGIGGALMRPVLGRAGMEGLPCYLETDERNVPFYRRHAFEVVSDGEVPKHGLRFWSMAGHPRSGCPQRTNKELTRRADSVL